MSTNALSRSARRLLLTSGAGLTVGFSLTGVPECLAQAPGRPTAARLAAPQPLEPATLDARGAPFEFVPPASPFQTPNAGPSVQPPAAAPANQPESTIPAAWANTFPNTGNAPMQPPLFGGAPPSQQQPQGGFSGWLANTTQSMKSMIGLGPKTPPPQPRIGQTPSPFPGSPFGQGQGPAPAPAPAPNGLSLLKPDGNTRPSGWDPRTAQPGPNSFLQQPPAQQRPMAGPPPAPTGQPESTRPTGWGSNPQAQPVQQPPFQGTAPNGAPVYAGSPAYRWYGWGSTTPGMNPYAPGGAPPQGSANWYAQTGATPGAFPVPVTNPFRPQPGAQPPEYYVTESAKPRPVTQASATMAASPAGPPLRTIAQTPPVGTHRLPAAPVPPPAAPSMPYHWKPQPGPAVPPAPTQTRVPEPQWQSVPATVPTSSPFGMAEPAGPTGVQHAHHVVAEEPRIARGQEPRGLDADVEAMIQHACRDYVTHVSIRRLDEKRVVIRLTAASDTLASFAINAIRTIPELEAFEVRYITQRPGS